MTDDKTEPLLVDVTDNPISHVRSRVVPGRVARPRESIDPHLSQARRTCAALVVSAANPPLRLQAEFELVGIGRLRTTALENFALQDHQELADGSFTLSFEYRGREPLVHVCASEAVYKALDPRAAVLREARVGDTGSPWMLLLALPVPPPLRSCEVRLSAVKP